MSKCTAAEAVTAMAYWVGYYEKASSKYVTRRDKAVFPLDKGSNNYTYPGWFCGIQGAWCAMLVSTVIAEACGSKIDAKTVLHGVWPYAACNQLYDAAPISYKGRRTNWKPEPGDVIVFSSNGSTREHTGMVEKVVGNVVHTIEGNKSNMCKRCSYKMNDSYIYGYVRPRYEEEKKMRESCTFDTFVMVRGSVGMGVLALQAALSAMGFKCGVDGEFGTETETAVKNFQKAMGLDADGEVGQETLSKLLYTE